MYTTYSPIDYAANYCEEFDPSSGSWIISNVWENPPRIYHVAWQSSEGKKFKNEILFNMFVTQKV